MTTSTRNALPATLVLLLAAACGGSDPKPDPTTPDPVASGAGGIAVTWTVGTDRLGGLLGGDLTYDASGRLTGFADGSGWGFADGVTTEDGNDGVVTWGRWTAGSSTHSTVGGDLRVLHYGGSTNAHAVPEAALATLARGYTGTSSPAPVLDDGATLTAGAADSVTGTLTLNYAANTASYAISVPVGGATYQLTGTASFVKGGAADSRFLGGGTVSGGGCSGSCAGWVPYGPLVQGAVFGTSGERAVLGFGFTAPAGAVSGVVVFR